MSRTLYKTGAFERSGQSRFCAMYGSFPCEKPKMKKCVTDRTEVGIL